MPAWIGCMACSRFCYGMTANGASLRPEDVLGEIFGEGRSDLHVVREDLLVEWDGRLVGPMVPLERDVERAVP